jgi:hypothetical protein
VKLRTFFLSLALCSFIPAPVRAQAVCQLSVCISPVNSANVTGLNDATSAGTFISFPAANQYRAEIHTTGTPDTIEVSVNGGAFGSPINLVAATPLALGDGVTIIFAASTGHTLSDYWLITTRANGSLNQETTVAPVPLAGFRNAQDKASDIFTAKDAGAKGDGITDDTANIAKGLNGLCLGGGGHLLFSDGAYMLNAASLPLPMCDNIEISGQNATLMIIGGSGSFNQIFGTRGQTVNNFHLHDVAVNMNSSNNALVSSGDLGSHCRCVLVFGNPTGMAATGSNVQIDHVTVSDVRSTWVFRSGASPTSITDNLITNVGGGTVAADSSIFYLDGNGEAVVGNQIISASPDQNLAVTAIETHGSAQVITGNVIVNMQVGMNVTGISNVTAEGGAVTGNTLAGVFQGIDIWSQSLSGGSYPSGCGIDNFVVSNNSIQVDQLSYLSLETAGAQTFGINLNGGATLNFCHLKVNQNSVTFDLSNSVTEPLNVSNATLGIGYYDVSSGGFSCIDCDYGYNTVANSPLSAFRYQANGQNISFDGDICIDGGSHLNPALNGVFRSCFFLAELAGAPIVGDMSANNSKCIDDLATSRSVYCYVLAANTTGQFTVDGAEVTCLDATCASMATGGGTDFNLVGPPSPPPFIRATAHVPGGALVPNSGSGQPQISSSILDTTNQLQYIFTGAQGWLNPDVGHITPLTTSNLTNCGSGATVGLSSTDRAGTMQMGTGPTTCVIAFTTTFVVQPVGAVTPYQEHTSNIFYTICLTITGGVPTSCLNNNVTYVASAPSFGVTPSLISISGASTGDIFGWSFHGN